MMNPMQMLNQIRNIKNPQQFIMSAFANQTPSPMIGNLIGLAQQGKNKEVEEIARNFCKERNMNFDEEFAKFMGRK